MVLHICIALVNHPDLSFFMRIFFNIMAKNMNCIPKNIPFLRVSVPAAMAVVKPHAAPFWPLAPPDIPR